MKRTLANRRRQLFISHKTRTKDDYGHWEVARNARKTKHSQAFTYIIWFPVLQLFYIGVKKLYSPSGEEHRWRTYKSSSKWVKALLQEEHQVEYLITNWFDTYEDAIAAETKEQYKVLAHTNPWCLNKSISGEQFFTHGPISQQTRDKMSAASLGKPKSEAHKASMSCARTGETRPPRTAEYKAKLSDSNAGIKNGRWAGYVNTPHGVFNTTVEAATYYDVDRYTISRRCTHAGEKWSEWYFISGTVNKEVI